MEREGTGADAFKVEQVVPNESSRLGFGIGRMGSGGGSGNNISSELSESDAKLSSIS